MLQTKMALAQELSDPDHASKLAGHEEIETTMKYVHLVERNLHLAVRLLTAYQENCHEFTTSEVVNIAANRA
jgi:hypothetical protein